MDKNILDRNRLVTIEGYLYFVSRSADSNGNPEIFLGIATVQDSDVYYGLLLNDSEAHVVFLSKKFAEARITVTSLGKLENVVMSDHRTIENVDMMTVRANRIVGYTIKTQKGDITYKATDEQLLELCGM